MNDKKLSVFISNSHNDNTIALDLFFKLREEGYSVFSYKAADSIPIGTSNWAKEIENALMKSNVFLLLVSPESLSSQWVNLETGFAISRAVKSKDFALIPILLGDVDFGSLPVLLQPWQFLDARKMGSTELGEKITAILSDFQKSRESR